MYIATVRDAGIYTVGLMRVILDPCVCITSEIITEVVIPYWMTFSVLTHYSSWQIFLQYLLYNTCIYNHTIFDLICIQPRQVYSQLE